MKIKWEQLSLRADIYVQGVLFLAHVELFQRKEGTGNWKPVFRWTVNSLTTTLPDGFHVPHMQASDYAKTVKKAEVAMLKAINVHVKKNGRKVWR